MYHNIDAHRLSTVDLNRVILNLEGKSEGVLGLRYILELTCQHIDAKTLTKAVAISKIRHTISTAQPTIGNRLSTKLAGYRFNIPTWDPSEIQSASSYRTNESDQVGPQGTKNACIR